MGGMGGSFPKSLGMTEKNGWYKWVVYGWYGW